MHSWSNFGRPATSGKIHLYSKFSLFDDNVSHCGSQSLGNIFVNHSRLIDINFFRLWHDVLPTSLCHTGFI